MSGWGASVSGIESAGFEARCPAGPAVVSGCPLHAVAGSIEPAPDESWFDTAHFPRRSSTTTCRGYLSEVNSQLSGYSLSSTYHYILWWCRDHRAACRQGRITHAISSRQRRPLPGGLAVSCSSAPGAVRDLRDGGHPPRKDAQIALSGEHLGYFRGRFHVSLQQPGLAGPGLLFFRLLDGTFGPATLQRLSCFSARAVVLGPRRQITHPGTTIYRGWLS